MYELTKEAFGKYTRYTLYNPLNGHAFSVVPERGANVLDIRFFKKSILDGYQTPEELEAAKWGKSVLLFPFPNRLDRGKYTWQGKQYEFPINNAATENAIHGFVRDEAFEVEYVFLAKDEASILCSYTYGGERPYYPFPFALEVEFSIHDNGTFTLETACRNLHDGPIPVGFGWHPYFRLTDRADQHRMQLPACEMVEINERMIPTGKRSVFGTFQKKKTTGDTFLDNCFHNLSSGSSYKLALDAAGRSVVVKASGRQFPFFQVFTPPHRESIALEPMTCNVGAFNNGDGLITLAPDKEWKA
ncbi:MAG: hypothetical protein KA165_04380, partial [Saprospiraceae bacterium]|nr:hypothetical protein [Saprospiraceae bacterium]